MNNQLYEKYILQIDKDRNITKAAQTLGISQPALSMGISQLEKKLGFPVFDRKTVPISPTIAGERYISYLKEKKILETDFRREIEDIISNTSNRVSIGAATIYIQSILVDAVAELHQQHPHFQIEIESATVLELLEFAKNGSLNCLISTRKPQNDEFQSIAIRKEKTYLCVPEGNPLNKLLAKDPDHLDLHLLDNQPMVLLKNTQPLQITVDQFLTKQGISPQRLITVDQISTALELTLKGIGCCFATSESLSIFKNSSIIYYAVSEIPDRYIYAVYPKGRYLSKACQALINLLTNKENNNESKNN